jgi:hypothetical protein
MNGMQQARAASIAAGSATLVASGPVLSEPALALLGAVAGLILLLGLDGRPRPHLAVAASVRGRSPETRHSTVFLREGGAESGGDAGPDPVSQNGRPGAEDENAEPAEPAEDTEHSAALSYEEFTARVEEEAEAEEISFLPPYASGGEETAQVNVGAGNEPWDIDDVDDSEDAAGGSRSKMPMPRHFALGTVAVIRKLLEPEDVERILAEQRRYPRLRFGDIAVQLGLLTEPQLQEVLLAQQQGVFTDAEIRDARNRMRSFREQTGAAGKR